MSPSQPYNGASTPGSYRSQDIDDAERGIYNRSESTLAMPALAHMSEKASHLSVEALPTPMSPVHQGITPYSSVPVLSLTGAVVEKPEVSKAVVKQPSKPKKTTSRWILFLLWFNTYRKFFIFITTLNLVGMIMAGVGRFHYAQNHLGALVLGNLLFAVLTRNELLLRGLYLVAIYGLRSVSLPPFVRPSNFTIRNTNKYTVGSCQNQAGSYFYLATCRRYPFRLCPFRRRVSWPIPIQKPRLFSHVLTIWQLVDILHRLYYPPPRHATRLCPSHRHHHERHGHHFRSQRLPLGSKVRVSRPSFLPPFPRFLCPGRSPPPFRRTDHILTYSAPKQ